MHELETQQSLVDPSGKTVRCIHGRMQNVLLWPDGTLVDTSHLLSVTVRVIVGMVR
jgi:hypothetical protein